MGVISHPTFYCHLYDHEPKKLTSSPAIVKLHRQTTFNKFCQIFYQVFYHFSTSRVRIKNYGKKGSFASGRVGDEVFTRY